MNIHEYQAKELLHSYGLNVGQGGIALTPQEAREVAETFEGPWVVKAQIHAGGRGKGGGIKVVKSLEEVEKAASSILGMTLITPQTGPQGRSVHKVYIEKACAHTRAFYVGLLVDSTTSRVTVLASSEGGVEIEEIARNTPDKIIQTSFDPGVGYSPFQGRKLAYGLGLQDDEIGKFMGVLQSLYKAFLGLDASLIEINPLVLTDKRDFMVLDAKLSFDDNALYRHSACEELRDLQEENPLEYEAETQGISYIKLEGTIGCLVNGAGLAMATMDLLKLYGGAPANFLDVGGGAPKERVTQAFKLILSDPHVKGILVNIFGGIMRCDIIAEGIVAAVQELGLSIPLVVRLEGTYSEQGKEIFAKSKLPIIAMDSWAEAAQRIVQEVA